MKLADYFKVTAILGLGFGFLTNQATELASGGGYYQDTIQNGRQFTLVGQFQGPSPLDFQRQRKELTTLLRYNRVSPDQPVVLRYTPANECGDAIGATIELPCHYSGGLEGSLDNVYQENVGMTFTLYLPIMATTKDEGRSIAYQKRLTPTTRLLAIRDPNGVWSTAGSGINGNVFGMFYSAVYPGRLYFWGQFTSLGGTFAGGYGYYENGTFTSLGTGPAIGTDIFSMMELPNGDLIVGGSFTSLNGTAITRLAYYTMSTGVVTAYGSPNNSVTSLAFSGGFIYAQGLFTNIGGSAINRFSRTTDGVTWTNLSAPTWTVYQQTKLLTGLDGSLYFVVNNAGTKSIYRYNPNSAVYTAIASGGMTGAGFDIAPNGDLYYEVGTANAIIYRYNGITSYQVMTTTTSGPQFDNVYFDGQGMMHVNISGLSANTTVLGLSTSGYFLFNGQAAVYPDIKAYTASNYMDEIAKAIDGSLAIVFTTSADKAMAGVSTPLTNTGTTTAYPTVTFRGPGTLFSIKNYTTGKAIYFDLVLGNGEEAVLRVTPSGVSFGSNYRANLLGSILPGSAPTEFTLIEGVNYISVFITYTAVELGDGSNVITSYDIQEITGEFSDNGILYVVVEDAGAQYAISFFPTSDVTFGSAVASTGVVSGTGTKTVSPSASGPAAGSTISGSIVVAATGVTDNSITISVPVVDIFWPVTHDSIDGAIDGE